MSREIILLTCVVIAVVSIVYSIPALDSLHKRGKITSGKKSLLITLTILLPQIGLIFTLIAISNAKKEIAV